MNSEKNEKRHRKDRPPPAVFSENPEESLEDELQEHPDNASTKVDVGSDESMDASDPISVVQPEHRDPVPSSGFEDDDAGESKS